MSAENRTSQLYVGRGDFKKVKHVLCKELVTYLPSIYQRLISLLKSRHLLSFDDFSPEDTEI